eukprot:CAMPEP_0117468884 /NCGR_PEP_ID=MMETSP0784-20121206/6409_1 /TAXON_ID=39447 /ORGANISM="" /LENGTH=135 /DNA_ID=CAMNT_0005262913 /DNA_START=9 /DNA_END=417 /DNA_ORIENTATION=+
MALALAVWAARGMKKKHLIASEIDEDSGDGTLRADGGLGRPRGARGLRRSKRLAEMPELFAKFFGCVTKQLVEEPQAASIETACAQVEDSGGTSHADGELVGGVATDTADEVDEEAERNRLHDVVTIRMNQEWDD